MNELRWILIGFGIVLLAAIYLWGRRLRPGGSARTRRAVIEPEHVEPDYRELDVPPHLRNPESRIEPLTLDRDENQTEPLDDEDASVPVEPAVLPQTAARDVERLERTEGDAVPVLAQTGESTTPKGGPDAPIYRRQRQEPLLGPLMGPATPPSRPPEAKRAEPQLGDVQTPPFASASRGGVEISERPSAAGRPRTRIFAIRLVSPAGRRYPGAALLSKLQEEGLQHGRYGIFHRLGANGESIFSVASMVEPGSFDLDSMPGTEFPGLTLFTLLPGPSPGADAIMAMIACSDRLQRALGGALQDENGMPLQQSRLESMWSEASALDAGAPRDSSPSIAN